MPLQGAALINAKHSRYYLINTKLPLSGTKLRSFIEQFLYMLESPDQYIVFQKGGKKNLSQKQSLETNISANQWLFLYCIS